MVRASGAPRGDDSDRAARSRGEVDLESHGPALHDGCERDSAHKRLSGRDDDEDEERECSDESDEACC